MTDQPTAEELREFRHWRERAQARRVRQYRFWWYQAPWFMYGFISGGFAALLLAR